MTSSSTIGQCFFLAWSRFVFRFELMGAANKRANLSAHSFALLAIAQPGVSQIPPPVENLTS